MPGLAWSVSKTASTAKLRPDQHRCYPAYVSADHVEIDDLVLGLCAHAIMRTKRPRIVIHAAAIGGQLYGHGQVVITCTRRCTLVCYADPSAEERVWIDVWRIFSRLSWERHVRFGKAHLTS